MIGKLPAAQRLALEKEDAPFLARPLTAEPDVMRAYLRQVVRLLRGRTASPCSDAMAFIAGAFERAVDAYTPPEAKAQIACSAGCAHCCVQPVLVTAPEALALARFIRGRDEFRAPLEAGALQVRDKPRTAQGWIRCPLLKESLCGVYEARPLSCHFFASLDLKDCIAAFVMMGRYNLKSLAGISQASFAARLLLYAALEAAGRGYPAYEMNNAVAAVLAQDNAEARWLAGEDILAGVAVLESPPKNVIAQIQALAGSVAATL